MNPRDNANDATGATRAPETFRKSNIGCVTVFGAGVTGLTVAHELVERGFRVLVVEPNKADDGQVTVGGMARTQFANGRVASFKTDPVFPWNIPSANSENSQFGPKPAFERQGRSVLFETGKSDPADATALAQACRESIAELVFARERYRRLHPEDTNNVEGPRLCITAFVYRYEMPAHILSAGRDAWLNNCQAQRNHLVLTELEKEAKAQGVPVFQGWIPPGQTRRGVGPGSRHVLIEVLDSNDEIELPGEHGYRFFPSFYRHVFDSMRRTPLYDVNGEETERTAFDQLVPTYGQLFAGKLSTATLSRTKPRSFEALRLELTRLLEELKFEAVDIAMFTAKLMRWLTTCSERRHAEYENISWWDYLTQEGVKYSQGFEAFLKSAPQALVALDTETGDARTQGNIVTQMLIDQLTNNEHTDCTLNGPTSSAWLEKWRDHLIHMGVMFLPGKLTGFEEQEEQREYAGHVMSLKPKFTLFGFKSDGTSSSYEEQVKTSDYFVVATDVLTAERVSRSLAAKINRRRPTVLPGRPIRLGGVPAQLQEFATYCLSRTDIAIQRGDTALRDQVLRERFAMRGYPDQYWGYLRNREEMPGWLEFPEGHEDLRLGKPRPGLVGPEDVGIYGLTAHDRFQTMSGVQFFFAHDLEAARGHVYYLESEWGLSSISPMQFWQKKNRFRKNGVLGMLTVDIGNFRKRSHFLGKAAHECDAEELAFEVWRQISESFRRSRRANGLDAQRLPLPRPIYYHIDSDLKRVSPDPESEVTYWGTSTPYLVNNVGDWRNRPGADPWDPGSTTLPRDLVAEPGVWQADHGGYQVHNNCLVFAGTYLRTFTRLNSMEAANESGRHAVNAILDHAAAVNWSAERSTPALHADIIRREADVVIRQEMKKLIAEMLNTDQMHLLNDLDNPPDQEQIAQLLSKIPESDQSKKLKTKLEELDQSIPRALLEDILKGANKKVPFPLSLQTVAGEHCKIWDPEKHEVDDLAFLKRVDAMMFEKGLPHMADVIGLDAMARATSPKENPFEGMLTSLLSTLRQDFRIDEEGVARAAKGATGAGTLAEQLRQGLTRLMAELDKGKG